MFRVLENFNLFPYSHLWRIGNQQENHDKCSIIFSIVALLLVGGIFAQRLTTVFQKTSITATSQTFINYSPPPATIVTDQQNTVTTPFMIAFDLFRANPQFNSSDTSFQISSYVDHFEGPNTQNRASYNESITLEPCTPQHFSIVGDISVDFVSWGAANWMCLPLNKSYIIQGSWALDKSYSSINMLFNCSGNCQNTLSTTLNIDFYILGQIVNPHNGTNPQQYFLQEITIPVQKGQYLEYSNDLTENIIQTDNSLLPWQTNTQTRSIKPDGIKKTLSKQNQNDSSTLFYFQRSTRTIVHTRSFLKLLDAISYVGGIFKAILAFFFFVLITGRILYEFKFAGKYFRTQQTKNFSLRSFISLLGFKILRTIKCEPDWSEDRQRDDIQKTVNNLLDVVHLQKRIDFLERAISILFQEHQLKGLHLIHDLTVQEAKNNFKQYQLRDNLITYLHDKEKDIGYALHSQEYFKWSLFDKNYYKQFQDLLTGELWKRDGFNQIQIGRQRQIEPNGSRVEMERRGRSRQEEYIMMRRGREREMERSKKGSKYILNIPMQKQKIDHQLAINSENIDPQNTIKNDFNMLRSSYADIGKLQIQFNENDLRRELENSLQTLLDEADRPQGDIRSKKIFDSLDDWLKIMLKAVIKPKYRRMEQQNIRKDQNI